MKKKTLVLIDGNAIIHRAYYAIPPLTTKDNTMVNAVFGFSSMLLKVLSDLKPDYLAVSFDVAGGTFRDDIYEDYKGTRSKADQDLYDQIPFCHEVVETFDIPIYKREGFEADDVIGTIAHTVKDEDVTTIIVTGDKDLLQLVDDKTTEVYLLKRGLSEFDLYDEEKVIEKFGFGPDRIVDFKALMGDSSDNIPGVAGVGKVTATKLIKEVGGIDEIYSNLEELEQKGIRKSIVAKLDADKDNAYMSQELATIKTDVLEINFKLDDATVAEFDTDAIRELLQKFEFVSLLNRVPGMKKQTKQKNHKIAKSPIKTITADNVDPLLAMIKNNDSFFCKAVTDGVDVFSSHVRGFVFVVNSKSFFLELGDDIPKQVHKIFAFTDKILVGHDLKQLLKTLHVKDIVVENKLFDVMVASYVLNSSTRAHDMRSVVLREFGQDLGDATEQGSLFGVNPSLVGEEGLYCVDLYKKKTNELEEDDNIGLFESVEMELVPVLATMELHGMAVDVDMLNTLSEHATKTIEKLNKKIWKSVGEEFNVASSVQLREVLYEKLELPTENIKKGKTGYSTASSELQKLHGLHPIIEWIEEFREVSKLQNTYTDVLPKLVNKKTNRIHTSFNQTVASTGRLSSSDPNLQNIPIRTELGREIRETFIAEQGYTLVAADYSQIELRIAASLAKDKTMLEIFEQGKDIHTATAAAINDVKESQVTKEMRYAAKAVNFGILYGMGAFGLAWRAQIPQWQAKEFIEKYFENFDGVKTYLDQTLDFAREEGYVETLFGRKRFIPELLSDNYQLRSAGERMAINMPIQGTAADLMKLAMIAVQQKIEKHTDWGDDVRLILQVHDELVLEVKKGLEDEVSKMVEQEMKRVADLRVPIEVNVCVGESWGKLK